MIADYSISVLKEQRNKLQDKLIEIAEGQYNKYPTENISKLKKDLGCKIRDIEFAIGVLFEQ